MTPINSILPRAAALVSRNSCYNNNYNSGYGGGYGGSYSCNSAWSRWGRWVLAGILIFIGICFLLVIALCAMRRKRRNRKRYESTTTPMANVQQPVGGGYQNDQPAYARPSEPAPPLYSGNYEAGNAGYYGQQGGVTLPQGAYVK
ncbi:hypothetical protein LSUB1_G005066 [Lachnellula subtilissima]|uniref:Protein RCR2 n=1 Tax=Lachnellula subtilissima TaxID=602034 RepID=A0A8H8RJ94_9HELO|nr:hypothetical protein LSUB1_G005066 [Lachnellula subtilissima]